MSNIHFISPIDQPMNQKRLLDYLKAGLESDYFDTFGLIVAFVKQGPLLRMENEIDRWLNKKKKIVSFFGIDHGVTSKEALEFALNKFNEAYVITHPVITFHPKIYYFTGSEKATIIVGSNNLTVGGTETNFESCLKIDFDLKKEMNSFNKMYNDIQKLYPSSCGASFLLTKEILDNLASSGLVKTEQIESTSNEKLIENNRSVTVNNKKKVFGEINFKIQAASTLKKVINENHKNEQFINRTNNYEDDLLNGNEVIFIIQIKPHHNSEIFLSKTAINENESFFGFPFTGSTIPKKKSNKSYPQRTPDPIVNITVFGENNEAILRLHKYNLNIVYYEPKSEIRITASPLISIHYVP